MRLILIRLWHRWKEITAYFGDFQAHLLLTVFYFTVLAPWGLFLRFRGDRLALRSHPAGSAWAARQARRSDIKDAMRQY